MSMVLEHSYIVIQKGRWGGGTAFRTGTPFIHLIFHNPHTYPVISSGPTISGSAAEWQSLPGTVGWKWLRVYQNVKMEYRCAALWPPATG